MRFIFHCCLLLCLSCRSTAQPDKIQPLNEVATKLQDGSATVSVILADKRYLAIHTLTTFRDLIRAHSSTGVLVIASPEEPGKKIRVMGTVTDSDGKPVAAAVVYMYQTDAKGWYAADAPHVGGNEGDMQHARLFGYVKTDANGKFELHTIKPSGYPRSDLPAHIHVHVWAPGYRHFVNEFLFDDDERLVGEIREQSMQNGFLTAKPEKTSAPFEQQFSYHLQLTKQRQQPNPE